VADLAVAISTAQRRPYTGASYRQQSPKYGPISGEGARMQGGRFNPPNSFAVLYLCTTASCAAAEFMRFATDHPIGPAGFLPRALYRYSVDFSNVLDLTDRATLDHLDVAADRLVQEDRTLTHQIGELAHQFLYQGVLNGSATGVDSVLSVFTATFAVGASSPNSKPLGPTSTTSRSSDTGIGIGSRRAMKGGAVSNRSAQPVAPRTIEEIVARVTPMGNLQQFLVDDLTADEQDVFYRLLEQA
jgi:RES domain-containing protein